MEVNIPRFVIAAPHSGSGKTTITVGLMAAFAERMTVQGYKVGPDYIDPGYHTAVTGRASHNLDTWMVPTGRVKELFTRSQSGADLSIIEGVMGLFDGYGGLSESGSTVEVAKLLHAPVVLVMDAHRMVRSAGAIALGFRDFDPGLNLAGVIVNNVSRAAHAGWVTEVIQSVGLRVFGWVPRDESLHVPERHLGLYTAEERGAATRQYIQAARKAVRRHLDLPGLEALARSAPEMSMIDQPVHPAATTRIGVARDEAFSFYYEDNLDLLRKAGAELVFFSPLRDSCIPPDLCGLYLGGGYPELYAAQLSENGSMRAALKSAVAAGMPTYAECGGLMSLAEYFVDSCGIEHPMVGILPGFTRLTGKLKMGYREVVGLQPNLLLGKGETARGHEFHYSEWVNPERHNAFAYGIRPRAGNETRSEGFSKPGLLASYIHLHFASNPDLARNFVKACCSFRKG